MVQHNQQDVTEASVKETKESQKKEKCHKINVTYSEVSTVNEPVHKKVQSIALCIEMNGFKSYEATHFATDSNGRAQRKRNKRLKGSSTITYNALVGMLV